MAQQSYREVFVANTGTLLANGATVETLADGQIGILDAKTYLSDTTPTYANQKAIKLVWGTPNVTVLTNQGVPNENIYTHLIKGNRIIDFKGFAADPSGTKQAVTIGNKGSGTADLVANKGEVKHVYVKLTGGQIDKKFSLNGVTKYYTVVDGVVGDSGLADPDVLANQLVAAINADKDIKDFVTATKVSTGAYRGVKVADTSVVRVTDDATMQYFPMFEQEAIHIQISEFDPNYNNDIDAAVTNWEVNQVVAYSPVLGRGTAVQKLEKEALSYHLKERSSDPVVRAIEGYSLKAVPTTFYDEYILTFAVDYVIPGGWAEKKTDIYKLHVFFADGTGGAFETAINGYLNTIGSTLDPVAIA